MLKEFREKQILEKTISPRVIRPTTSEDIFPNKKIIETTKFSTNTNMNLKPLKGLTTSLKPVGEKFVGEDQRKKILEMAINKVK